MNRTASTMVTFAVFIGFASATFWVSQAIPAARPSAMIADAVGAVFGFVAMRRLRRADGSGRRLAYVLAVLAAVAFAVTTVLATDALCLHGYRAPDGSCAWE